MNYPRKFPYKCQFCNRIEFRSVGEYFIKMGCAHNVNGIAPIPIGSGFD